MKDISRREFLKRARDLSLSLAGWGILSSISGEAKPRSLLVISSKGTVYDRVKKIIDNLGGIRRFVKRGSHVAIKPNAAWARTPRQAANTHPLVVAALIRLFKEAGAGSITIYENPCDNYRIAFEKSGIALIAKKYGVRMVPAVRSSMYREVAIPKGINMKSMKILSPLLEADCYINVPIVKVHSAAKVSIALKNQMGAVEDRGYFHRSGLHQCIADLSTVLKPHLVIADATRILLTHGPRGPGKVKKTNLIIGSTDIVAVDAYGAKLLGYNPATVGHIVMAHKHGMGEYKLSNIKLIKV